MDAAQATPVLTLPYPAREWQERENAHLVECRFLVLVVNRRAGKTVFAVKRLVDAALKFKGTNGRFGYVAPYLKQAHEIAWSYLEELVADIPGVERRKSDLAVTLPNGARIRLYGADTPDSMRGIYLDGVVIDEFADMKPGVWGSVVRPMLADRKGWAIFIGTPRGMDAFFQLYEQAADLHGWGRAKLDVHDTACLDPAELELARATMSEAQFRQEFLCDFNASNENVLLKIDAVQESMTRILPDPDMLLGLPRVLGVDVARYGGDRSVIARRHGMVAYPPAVFQDLSNMELVGQVIAEINDFNPDAVFIDGGRGEGVIDRLRELKYPIHEVAFGGRSSNPRLKNKRTEMYVRLADWVRDGGILPDDRDLKLDLTAHTYSMNSSGVMVLGDKDKLRKDTGHSTDVSDAYACTFAENVGLPMLGPTASTRMKMTEGGMVVIDGIPAHQLHNRGAVYAKGSRRHREGRRTA